MLVRSTRLPPSPRHSSFVVVARVSIGILERKLMWISFQGYVACAEIFFIVTREDHKAFL